MGGSVSSSAGNSVAVSRVAKESEEGMLTLLQPFRLCCGCEGSATVQGGTLGPLHLFAV